MKNYSQVRKGQGLQLFQIYAKYDVICEPAGIKFETSFRNKTSKCNSLTCQDYQNHNILNFDSFLDLPADIDSRYIF